MSKLQLIKNKNVESIYPLSPMQQGMLFHTLYEPESGVYFEQFCLTISGNLNVMMLQQACEQVVKRHPILRTLVVWEKQEKPLQVVCKQVELPWNNYDWRSLSPKEQQERLEAFLQADRVQGFILDKALLMRFTLIQITKTQFLLLLELIITNPKSRLSELSLLFHKRSSRYRAM